MSDGMVYIVYESDLSGMQRHSGIYSDPLAAKVILDEWKEERDGFTEDYMARFGRDDNCYDRFTITGYPLDCEHSGHTVYEAQGLMVSVNELDTPQ